MHHLWTSELLRWVKPRLPAGYRAFIGSAPVLAIGAPMGRPDVGGQSWPNNSVAEPGPSSSGVSPGSDDECAGYRDRGGHPRPEHSDLGGEARTTDRGHRTDFAQEQGSAVFPRNVPGTLSGSTFFESVHLLLVDVHRRPIGFSFADRIAQDLSIAQAPLPTPLAVSYRVGEPAAMEAVISPSVRRELKVGATLSKLPLPLSVDCNVWVDLERIYSAAGRRCLSRLIRSGGPGAISVPGNVA